MAIPVLTPIEEQIVFHFAIGQAIAQWAHVENALYNICVVAFGEKQSPVLGASFHSIDNFRTKLSFTDSAVQQSSRFTELVAEWSTERDRARGLSVLRNKIAHSRTIGYPEATPGRREAIVPISFRPLKKQRKAPGPPPDSLCVKDIDLAARQFARASNALLGIMAKAQGHRWRPAESSQQELQVRSLKEIRSLIDATRLQRA
ncbi:hypothetical protein [Altererythrobacter fulvus]|uniref:hypothetical protein n=1 Tax=Caenibius fulvus TaxID=2126012 RepID=UPI003018A3B2